MHSIGCHIKSDIPCNTHSGLSLSLSWAGGRGLRREVWKNPPSIWVLDYFLTEPLSPDNSVHERAYRDSSDPREFGERYNFVQRYTGFFVPPVTSLYTFSIISDDLSRLYLSPTADADDKEMIASAPQHTRNRWDEFESQTSEPMMMERGQYYYMEAYSNNGGGVLTCSCMHGSRKSNQERASVNCSWMCVNSCCMGVCASLHRSLEIWDQCQGPLSALHHLPLPRRQREAEDHDHLHHP